MGMTIKVSDEIWEKLNKDKKPGETFVDKINELIKIKENIKREIHAAGKTNIIQISILRRILENASMSDKI